MGVLDIVLGIALLVCAVFLVVVVLLQESKKRGLDGAIGGSSVDSYFGKNKGMTKDKLLSKLTMIVSIVFAVLVLAAYLFQTK